MRVKVRLRTYADGRQVWTADVHVAPAGEQAPDRFRVVAPPGVRSQSGAERWAMETARKIAAEGRPHNTRKARAERARKEEAERARYVPTIAELWPVLVERLQAERAAPTTLIAYAQAARLRILPLIGSVAADRVGDIEVARLKASMRTIAPSTANLALVVLRAILMVGRRTHPAISLPEIKRIRKHKDEHLRVYTVAEAMDLVQAAERWPARLAALLLALDAGLRCQEVAALRWVDVDLKRGEVHVCKTMHRGELYPTKSGKPRRVPLTSRLSAALRALPQADDWVLPRSRVAGRAGLTGGTNGPVSLVSTLATIARAAGVPDHRPHSLRHTFASHLLAAGADLPAVSRLLGHSSVAITASTYAHVMPGAERGAVDKLEAMVALPAVTDLSLARAQRRASR